VSNTSYQEAVKSIVTFFILDKLLRHNNATIGQHERLQTARGSAEVRPVVWFTAELKVQLQMLMSEFCMMLPIRKSSQ
jgi:hypothetical protein